MSSKLQHSFRLPTQYVFVLILHLRKALIGTSDTTISNHFIIHFWVNLYFDSNFHEQIVVSPSNLIYVR